MNGKHFTTRGFTLIEIIVTLLIASILGVFVYQYMGASLMRSSDPIFRLQKSLPLQQVAENITADYKRNYTANLPGLKTMIEVPMKYAYGSYSYTVTYNDYITFNAANQSIETTEQKMLKVTIKNDQNETLTLLFVSV